MTDPKYKVVTLSELLKMGIDFEMMTYALLGKGQFVIVEKGEPDSWDWFPMGGENRFESEGLAKQAILSRLQMEAEMKALEDGEF